MPGIMVTGGGFAGVWAAAAAARLLREAGADHLVTLVAPGDDLVIRPRLYEADPQRMRVPLDRFLGPIGVRRVKATATGRFTAVVVGAGFTGLETATELVQRLRAVAAPHGAVDDVRVVLVDRDATVGLGPGPRPVIEAALDELGVLTRLGVTPTRVDDTGVTLSDGSRLPARTVVWTAGIEANPLTASVPAPRDRIGRLKAGPYLTVDGVPGLYAAGDVAAAATEGGHTTLPSCQHAIPLGKTAGHNAAADLLGLPSLPFAPEPYVTCLDLGAAGAVLTSGYERTVRLTGSQAKTLKRTITQEWIHPPLDDAQEILRQAHPTVPHRAAVSAGPAEREVSRAAARASSRPAHP